VINLLVHFHGSRITVEHISIGEILSRNAIWAIRADDDMRTEDFASCEHDDTFVGINVGDSCVVLNLGTEVGGGAV
jgi:hypothetical protein